MTDVLKFPGQHRNYPRCLACNRDLPTFDDLVIILPADTDGIQILRTKLLVTIKCTCRAEWLLIKDGPGF